MFSMPDFLQVHYPLLTGGGTYRSIRRTSERAAACNVPLTPPLTPPPLVALAPAPPLAPALALVLGR